MPRDRHIKILMDWHRRVGLFMVVILIIVLLTGFLMNHTEHLQLDKIKLTQPGLLKWYGLEQKKPVMGFPVNDRTWIAAVDAQLYVNQKAVVSCTGSLHGALEFQHLLVALCHNGLHLLSEQGELLESITPDQSLPERIESIGVSDNLLVLMTANGASGFDLDSLQTLPVADNNIQWASAEEIPADLFTEINSTHITLQKLVQDIHSGRILGGLGIWLVDLSALLLLVLTVTGLWAWLRHWKNTKKS